MLKLLKILILLIVGGWSTVELRAELVRNENEGVRPLGMGGAFIALADDHNASWYNPAGLGFIKPRWGWNVVDLTLGVDSIDTFNRFMNGILSNDYSNMFRPDQQYNKFTVRSTLSGPYFTLTFFNHFNSYVDLQNMATPSMRVDMYTNNDSGAQFAIGFPVIPHISIGASLRAFLRTGIDANLTAQDFMDLLLVTDPNDINNAVYNSMAQLMGTGWAIGGNVGTIVKVPMPAGYPKIQLAATIEDFTNTEFRSFGATVLPPTIPQSINFGAAVTHEMKGGDVFNLTFDMRRPFEGLPYMKTLHLGAEYKTKGFAIRGGLYQGNPTFGASIDILPHTRIHFASYSAELGASIWARTQRWWLAQVIVGFNPF